MLLCPVSSIIACNLELFGDTSLALLFIDFGIAINIPFLGLPSRKTLVAGLKIICHSGSDCSIM